VGLFFLPAGWSNLVCALLFAIAALTDWLDGYLARRSIKPRRSARSSIRWPTS
jgi:phosphatidylglycerophosphate synthase